MILKYFSRMMIVAVIVALAGPACCCFAGCASAPVFTLDMDSHGMEGCCEQSDVLQRDSLEECVCHPSLRAVSFTQRAVDSISQNDLWFGVFLDVVLRRQTVQSDLVQEDRIFAYKGPPIFILNCVYRC